ncbi:MAG: hypothetical protein L0287_24940 [Anaerolineae bacterium]|nr:hypothetical protein [Anaerolineae bacterium]MCI0608779.1 hypothetical protein [Anaerolineae bacterium]
MDKITATRAGLAIIIFVMGSLQAWDSDVPAAGLLIVSLVSLAIALPPVALLVPLKQSYFLGVFALLFILLILARLISPIPLPGLFIVLVPAVMGLIFTGIFRQDAET